MVEAQDDNRFSLLPDPLPDRKLTDAECPKIINKSLESSQLWGSDGLPNWRLLKDFLAREGPITKEQIVRILNEILQFFKTEANLVEIEEPICVVGDIHG